MENLNLYIKEALVNHKVKNIQYTLTVGEIIDNYFRQQLPVIWLSHKDLKDYENLLDVKKPLLKRLFDSTVLSFIYSRHSKYIVPVCTWTECYRIFQQEKNNEPELFIQEYNETRNQYDIQLKIHGINQLIRLHTKNEIK